MKGCCTQHPHIKNKNGVQFCAPFLFFIGNYIPVDTRCSSMNKYAEQDSIKMNQPNKGYVLLTNYLLDVLSGRGYGWCTPDCP